MNRINVIQKIIDRKKAKVYLEIGVAHGDCFFLINAPTKIGVDPGLKLRDLKRPFWSLRPPKKIPGTLHEITSDAFFASVAKDVLRSGIDVAFVDGLHTYEQSLKDVENCLTLLNDGGVIVLHDCNPPTEISANPLNPYEHGEELGIRNYRGSWSGTVWKTIIHLRSLRPDLDVFVLNCDYGLGIVTKRKPENILGFSDETVKHFGYRDLIKDRKKHLNLKGPGYLRTFLKTIG